jgi:hypothetical protein
VNVVVIQTLRGRDSKHYPSPPLTREQRNQARWLAHHLVHRDHMSVRQAQATMLASYACRRSLGSIMRDLRLWQCPWCAAPKPSRAPAAQEQPSAAVRQVPGGLTGMLAGDG